MKSKHLEDSLDEVVESCVNYVGVDVNTASPALLRYVSGLNQLTARRVYEYRREHGPFRSREQLREVAGFGDATFVQAAGFLKIAGGDNPLDATWIHPESYPVADKVMEHFQCKAADLADKEAAAALAERMAAVKLDELAKHVAESLAKQVAEKPAPREQEYPLFPDEPSASPAVCETASEVSGTSAEAAPLTEERDPEASSSAQSNQTPLPFRPKRIRQPREASIGTLTLRDILAQARRGLAAIRAKTCRRRFSSKALSSSKTSRPAWSLPARCSTWSISAASSISACTTAAWSTSAAWPTASSAIHTKSWRWAMSFTSG